MAEFAIAFELGLVEPLVGRALLRIILVGQAVLANVGSVAASRSRRLVVSLSGASSERGFKHHDFPAMGSGLVLGPTQGYQVLLTITNIAYGEMGRRKLFRIVLILLPKQVGDVQVDIRAEIDPAPPYRIPEVLETCFGIGAVVDQQDVSAAPFHQGIEAGIVEVPAVGQTAITG